MKMIGKLIVVITIVGFMISVPWMAGAAETYKSTWTITDPSGDATPVGKDIINAYTGSDSQNIYFKIQLAGTPATQNFYYNIFIDTNGSESGGAIGGGSVGTLTGIDYIISAQSNTGNSTWKNPKFYVWDGSAFVQSSTHSPVLITTSSTGGTLSWYYTNPTSGADRITGPWKYWAGTGATYSGAQTDLTTYAQTPIPSAAWLLGSGVIGLIGLKRRKRKTA